jgi:cytoskeletal protein CcmA (bactofilin family)
MGWLSEKSAGKDEFTARSSQEQPANNSTLGPAEAARPAIEQATIGRSLVIKGEIKAVESLFIDGRVEGAILVPENRVTIGPHGSVVSDIEAREVIIMGKVKGNIHGAERADFRSGCAVTGDTDARRIMIEDGAMIRGSVEVRRAEQEQKKTAPQKKVDEPRPAGPATDPPANPDKPEFNAMKIEGSFVLLKEDK